MSGLPHLHSRERQLYDALLAQITEDVTTKDGYAVLRTYPVPAVASALGYEESTVRSYLRALGKEYYKLVQNGNERYWLVKLPDNDTGSQEQFDLNAEELTEIDELNTLIRQVAGRVHDLEAEIARLTTEAEETESLKTENARLKAENASLKGQVDQVIKTLGRIDLDILRRLITNEQETRSD
jgi:predicted transcriptional regulator